MSARHKLNAANAAGSLLLAALIGGAAQSVTVFVIALVALLILDLVAGHPAEKTLRALPRPGAPGRGGDHFF
jgi:hypothetical protein